MNLNASCTVATVCNMIPSGDLQRGSRQLLSNPGKPLWNKNVQAEFLQREKKKRGKNKFAVTCLFHNSSIKQQTAIFGETCQSDGNSTATHF